MDQCDLGLGQFDLSILRIIETIILSYYWTLSDADMLLFQVTYIILHTGNL